MNIKYLQYIAICIGLTVVVFSCSSGDDDTGGQTPPEFDRAAMLANYADNLILPAYSDLQVEVDQMAADATAFESEPTAANLETLQNALKSVRLSWQDANFYQFGPAETVTLRASLNTYPTDTDKIESNIENGGYTLGSIDNIAAGGLPALDYLIHGAEVTTEQIIAAFTTDPGASERMTYLVDNVAFVKSRVDDVVNSWDPAGDDYRGTFLSEGNGGTGVGSSISLLVNAMILHYERFMRDGKIGIPAGVRSAGVPRPTATEAFYGGYSAELAVANITGYKRLVIGGSGSGLDDYLEFMESDELSNDIQDGLDQSINDAGQLTDPLSENIENDNDGVIAVFTSLQEVLVLIKVDMTSVLGITITFQDNDGD